MELDKRLFSQFSKEYYQSLEKCGARGDVKGKGCTCNHTMITGCMSCELLLIEDDKTLIPTLALRVNQKCILNNVISIHVDRSHFNLYM